jgi:hypothetical protein
MSMLIPIQQSTHNQSHQLIVFEQRTTRSNNVARCRSDVRSRADVSALVAPTRLLDADSDAAW